MTREPDDHALRWSGDDDPSLVSGEAPVDAEDETLFAEPEPELIERGDEPGSDTHRPARAMTDAEVDAHTIADSTESAVIEDVPVDGGHAGPSEPDTRAGTETETPLIVTTDASRPAEGARAQISSVELILLGFLGGVYLLFTIGWIVSLLPRTVSADDPVAQAMAVASSVFAVLAPALWAVTTFWIARKRPMLQRIGWLALGVVFIVPWPIIGGAL